MVSSVLVLCRWTALRDIPHHRADLAVRQFQDTMQYQDALSRLGQAGKGSGHQPVADLKLTAIGRKYKLSLGY